MEPLVLKQRQVGTTEIECWDDDGDLQGLDDISLLRNISSTTIGSSTHSSAPHHRDSISSRLSMRSDMESNGQNEEDWQLLLPNDDEASTHKAISSAKSAGIPIPNNVPASALLGGTIKRLGGKRIKKVLGDDWGDDLELPKATDGGLKLRRKETQDFPEALRQLSSTMTNSPSQSKSQAELSFVERLQMSAKSPIPASSLEKFRETGTDDDFGDLPSIQIPKARASQRPSPSFNKSSQKLDSPSEGWDDDFDLPSNGGTLKLSGQANIRVNEPQSFGTTFEGAATSMGRSGSRPSGSTAYGPRSSSVSAMSPSIFSPSMSAVTAESEDDDLDGLEIPDGPLKLDEILKKRGEIAQVEQPTTSPPKSVEFQLDKQDDFFSGIDIGDGEVFDSGKLTLNRNIKRKTTRQTSPAKRTAMTLTFTNKPPQAITRIPKPQNHERSRSKLEPVMESASSTTNYRRSQSRLGHSTQSSITSVTTPSTPSFSERSAPSTPSRSLAGRVSREMMRSDPTTTSAQLLKAQRSMPAIKNQPSPARPMYSHQRPPSRAEAPSRTAGQVRPKTPIDRSGAETSLGLSRKSSAPFLPAGAGQSRHITAKPSRTFNRPHSSDSSEAAPLNRPLSRLSNPHHRPNTPNGRCNVAPEHLAREAAMKKTMTKPARRRVFGDGSELEVFDDLPTSATLESKFIKQPVARGNVKSSNLRNKLSTSSNPSLTSLSRTDSIPHTPLSPTKQMEFRPPTNSGVPRFARETTASRQRTNPTAVTAQAPPSRTTEPHGGALAPLSTNSKTHLTARPTSSPYRPTSRPKSRVPNAKDHHPRTPQLITPLNNSETKNVKGMRWNPATYRWEGNENALASFENVAPDSPPKSATGWGNGSVNSKPALIANVGGGAMMGVQVVGGMVFDPQRMCWLKMAPSQRGESGLRRQHSESSGNGNGALTPDTADDEEDVFAGLDDLDDSASAVASRKDSNAGKIGDEEEGAEKGLGLSGVLGDDEWLVGEEFDVGPEFVRRQRAEEERWRKKVEGWVGGKDVGREEGEEWKWGIRGLVGR
ncbi:hypothetical protein MMC25_000683 [Agyrium rufum]|nr:hypothetical protein [Agyrium rufum]